jgi:NodT family efflux transporter outer membrane factor (OMF) lipoprotein
MPLPIARFAPLPCLAVVLLTAGCAVGPDFHRPRPPGHAGYLPQPLPERTAAAPDGGAEKLLAGAEVPYRWWESFGSPPLNALVERALRANPGVAAAQASLKQALELKYAQAGAFYPSVGLDYNIERQQLAGNVASSTAPGPQGNGQVIAPSAPAQPVTFTFQTAQVQVGFVPDVFGLNRRKVESLDAQAEMQRFELEATDLTLAANVVGAAINEASLRAQIEATHAIVEHNEKLLAIIKDKFDHGYATRIDLAAQEAQLAQARATLPPLEKQLAINRDLLSALTGTLPSEEPAEHIDLASLTLPPELPVSLPAKLIDQRPDVRAAEQALRSANAEVGVAIAQMLPQFNISGGAGGSATKLSELFRAGGPFWSAIGDVSQPLFQGGTLLHQKRAAEAALEQAAAGYQNTVIQAYQNVADALHAVLSDADALAAAAAAVQAAKLTRDLTDERLHQGYSDYLAELAASMAYQQSVLALAQAQAARFADAAALYQALGGGWWNRTETRAPAGGGGAGGGEGGGAGGDGVAGGVAGRGAGGGGSGGAW